MKQKQYTAAGLVDLELYDFFELIAKSSITDVLVIKGALEKCRKEAMDLVNTYGEMIFGEKADPEMTNEKFYELHTKMLQSFAVAMYIDKKIELCIRRQDDLTPSCFKNVEN